MVVGQVVNHYRILKRLGGGGMGVVYTAEDLRLGRIVALKFLTQHVQGEAQARSRLLQEAKAAARLDHPNIGTIHAVEESDEGQLFISMAYYNGKTLETRLSEGRVGLLEALDIAYQVAQGLACAHAAGVIHRDIKPANLLATPDGLIKILDFGVAKLADSTMTGTGAAPGTFAYMAPETMQGQPAGVQSDLWSLGVCLYRLLTGTLPFGHSFPGVMMAILQREPPPLREYLPEAPPALEALLRRLLAKPLEERYARAEVFIKELNSLLDSLVVGASTATATPTLVGLTAAAVPHNLSTKLRPLLGREAELKSALDALRDPHSSLVTLLGQGGSGKTRLAQAVALEALQARLFPDGVFMVALETLQEATALPETIAAALGLDLPGQEDPWAALQARLKDKHLLLVLDNIDGLLAAGDDLDGFLTGLEHLRVLVTSRERLQLFQERLLEVGGLALPPNAQADFMAYPATALFLLTAQRSLPHFKPEGEQRESILRICRMLEGLPLAIELAAVWLEHLQPQDIERELERSLDFLETRARHYPARHRNMRAVLESSWGRLSPAEARTLRQLAVIFGLFRREAAAEVAGASLALLAALVDKSLLRVDRQGRYSRHPLVHSLSLEKLAAHPQEHEEARARHAHYYLSLLERHDVRYAQTGQATEAIDEALDNLRRAWVYRLERRHYPQALAMGEMLRAFYGVRGRALESQALFRAAEETLLKQEPAGLTGEGARLLGKVLETRAWLHHHLEEARILCERSLAVLEPLGDSLERGRSLVTLGGVLLLSGHYPAAQTQLAEALALYERLGLSEDRDALAALSNLSLVEMALGNYAQAETYYRRILPIARGRNDGMMLTNTLANLGQTLLEANKLLEAEAMLQEALELNRTLLYRAREPEVLSALGFLAYRRQDYAGARERLEAAHRLAQELGSSPHSSTMIATLLPNLARATLRSGDPQAAKDYLRAAFQQAQAHSNTGCALAALLVLAELPEGAHAQALLSYVCTHPGTIRLTRLEAEALLRHAPANGALPGETLEELVRWGLEVLGEG